MDVLGIKTATKPTINAKTLRLQEMPHHRLVTLRKYLEASRKFVFAFFCEFMDGGFLVQTCIAIAQVFAPEYFDDCLRGGFRVKSLAQHFPTLSRQTVRPQKRVVGVIGIIFLLEDNY